MGVRVIHEDDVDPGHTEPVKTDSRLHNILSRLKSKRRTRSSATAEPPTARSEPIGASFGPSSRPTLSTEQLFARPLDQRRAEPDSDKPKP